MFSARHFNTRVWNSTDYKLIRYRTRTLHCLRAFHQWQPECNPIVQAITLLEPYIVDNKPFIPIHVCTFIYRVLDYCIGELERTSNDTLVALFRRRLKYHPLKRRVRVSRLQSPP